MTYFYQLSELLMKISAKPFGIYVQKRAWQESNLRPTA